MQADLWNSIKSRKPQKPPYRSNTPSGKKAPWHWKSWKRDKKGTVKLHAIRFLREYEEVSHCIVFACTK